MREIKNARISGTFLGREDHGILTAYVYLDYGGGAQGFGGYCFDEHDGSYQNGRLFSGHAALFVSRVIEIAGVDTWEKLVGRSIRADADRMCVHRIGHYLRDEWFDPVEEFSAIETRGRKVGAP